jgi:hypothetical protein
MTLGVRALEMGTFQYLFFAIFVLTPFTLVRMNRRFGQTGGFYFHHHRWDNSPF